MAEVQEVVESGTTAPSPPLADGSRSPSEEPVHGLGIAVRSGLDRQSDPGSECVDRAKILSRTGEKKESGRFLGDPPMPGIV